MLTLIESPGRTSTLQVTPSTRAVVSWNTAALAGEIDVTLQRGGCAVSEAVPYARWSPGERRSFSRMDGDVRIEVDVIGSEEPFDAIAVRSTADLDALAASVPAADGTARPARVDAADTVVPGLSQYLAAYPDERGWCSPAALAMLLRASGVHAEIPDVAAGVRDDAYGGTGNWAFNVAYAGARGLRAAVVYLQDIDHAAALVGAGFGVAISIGWSGDELPGAPLEHSEGHLVVVRGADAVTVAVNDPAHPEVAVRYPRAALDRVFRAHGGVAYLLGPRRRTAELVALANA